MLPEPGDVRRPTAVFSSPATTLRGATGERATLDDDPGAGDLSATGRRRRPAVGVAVVLALVAIGVGVAVRELPKFRGPISAAAPVGATTASPPNPSGAAAPPPAPVAPALPHPLPDNPAPASSSPEVPPAPATAPPVVAVPKISPPIRLRRHEHQQLVGTKTPPEPEHKPVANPPGVTKAALIKPNCNPKFYFDAQGDKHFKPECF